MFNHPEWNQGADGDFGNSDWCLVKFDQDILGNIFVTDINLTILQLWLPNQKKSKSRVSQASRLRTELAAGLLAGARLAQAVVQARHCFLLV